MDRFRLKTGPSGLETPLPSSGGLRGSPFRLRHNRLQDRGALCCPLESSHQWSRWRNRRRCRLGKQRMACHCLSGWVCEIHPDQPWPHSLCRGAGAQCPDPDCPWWRGSSPAALRQDRWSQVNAPRRAEPLESGGCVYRVVQSRGPHKGRQATLVSEHATAPDAFREVDRLVAERNQRGEQSDSIELLVVDADGRVMTRRDA